MVLFCCVQCCFVLQCCYSVGVLVLCCLTLCCAVVWWLICEYVLCCIMFVALFVVLHCIVCVVLVLLSGGELCCFVLHCAVLCCFLYCIVWHCAEHVESVGFHHHSYIYNIYIYTHRDLLSSQGLHGSSPPPPPFMVHLEKFWVRSNWLWSTVHEKSMLALAHSSKCLVSSFIVDLRWLWMRIQSSARVWKCSLKMTTSN